MSICPKDKVCLDGLKEGADVLERIKYQMIPIKLCART